MMPVKVTDAEVAYPASVRHLMPPDIVEIYRNRTYSRDLEKIVSTWFFRGVRIIEAIPKAGIDTTEALRHIRCIMGSYAPKHEHKTAAVAYLLGEWFEKFDVEPMPEAKRLFSEEQPIKSKPKSKKRSKR